MQLGEVTLRQFQERALNDVRSELVRLKAAGRPPRVLVVAPCGAGKTIMSSGIIRGALDKARTSIFMAAGRILIDQKSRVLDRCGISHAVLMRGEEFWESSVCVASKDTYASRVVERNLFARFKRHLWIIDEAHLALSDAWMDILMYDPEAVYIGFTATPVRGNGKGMGGFWQGMVKASTYDELIGLGYLVEPRIFSPWSVDTRGLSTGSNGDWSWQAVSDRMNNKVLVGNIVDEYVRLGERRPFGCFASSVEHSIGLRDEFNSRNIPCEHVDADTDPEDRRRIFADVESGKLRGVCNFGVLRVGFDLPILGCGILAFASDSIRTIIQICGRFLRAHPTKRDCILIDHGANIERIIWPTLERDWQLDPERDLQFTEQNAGEGRPPQEPMTCRKCGAMRQSGTKCPHCGNQFHRKGTRLMTVDGELVEIKKKQVQEKTEATDLQKRWNQIIGMCCNTGRTYQQAKIIFHSKYKVWPTASVQPQVPESQQRMKCADLFPERVRRKFAKG